MSPLKFMPPFPPNIPDISNTFDTSQVFRSRLKLPALLNMLDISVTAPTFHPDMSWLKLDFLSKRLDMSVTSEVSQSAMSLLHPAPQYAAPEEQQFSPEVTAAKHRSTAVLSAALFSNALPDVHEAPATETHAPGGPSYALTDTANEPVHTALSWALLCPQLV
jgi:hypothetical protein